MVKEAPRGRPGRPRDEDIDDRILTATLDLLAAKGYAGLRADALAAAAGVPKSTIYRRWPSLAALAVAAIERAVGARESTATDDPAADLVTLVGILHGSVLDTGLATFLPRLGVDIVAHPEAAGRYRERVIEPLRQAAIDAVRRGGATGLWAPATAEDADRAVNLILGGAIYEVAFLGRHPSVADTLAAASLVLGRPLT